MSDHTTHHTNQNHFRTCIHTLTDPRAEAEFPNKMSAVARVKTTKGDYGAFVAMPKGEPGNFLSPAELRAKFDGLVGPYLPPDRLNDLASRLLAIHKEDDIYEVLRLTLPVPTEIAAASE